MNIQSRLISGFLIFFSLLLFLNVLRTLKEVKRGGEIIKKTQERLREVKEEQDELERRLAGVQSQEYIEKQAREKLNLGKEGEIVVILPSIEAKTKITPTPDLSFNWQKWIKVFW